MKSIAVFCGSNLGSDPSFRASARELAAELAKNKITVVYGGARVGLMGEVADSALQHQGKVIGVLPKFLQRKELAHKDLSELILCESMHERKQKMFELSEGFIALPGAFGTLEEIFEIITWQQLGLHPHPVGFLNVNGFFDHLQVFVERIEESGLIRNENRSALIFEKNIPELLQRMKKFQAPSVTKWIDLKTS